MKKSIFRIGDFATVNERVIEINGIIDDDISSDTWGTFHLSSVKPIKIGSGYDSAIRLEANTAIAPYCGHNDPFPLYKSHSFMQWAHICDAVKENNMIYVHEVQHWLADSKDGSYLRLWHE